MAVIDPDAQARVLYQNSGPHRLTVFGIKSVATGDTLDVAAHYSKVQTAIASSLTSASNGLPTISGTVVTFAQAGLSNDTVTLLVIGGWS